MVYLTFSYFSTIVASFLSILDECICIVKFKIFVGVDFRIFSDSFVRNYISQLEFFYLLAWLEFLHLDQVVMEFFVRRFGVWIFQKSGRPVIQTRDEKRFVFLGIFSFSEKIPRKTLGLQWWHLDVAVPTCNSKFESKTFKKP